MRVFWEIAKKGVRRQFAYRTAVLAGTATNLFFGLMRVAVMIALYGAQTEVAGITLNEAITYTGVSQAAIGFLSMFNWFRVIASIHSGEVSSDLLKPFDYFAFWLAQDLGRVIVEILLRSVPILAAYAVFVDIVLPQTLSHWIALTLALLLASLVSFSWRFLVNLSAFWTPNALGIARFAFILSWFMSGFMMPLRFFPDWFVQICYLTPFPHTVNTLIEVYLGLLSGGELVRALLLQAGWALGLAAACQIVMARGIRKLVIQGG